MNAERSKGRSCLGTDQDFINKKTISWGKPLELLDFSSAFGESRSFFCPFLIFHARFCSPFWGFAKQLLYFPGAQDVNSASNSGDAREKYNLSQEKVPKSPINPHNP